MTNPCPIRWVRDISVDASGNATWAGTLDVTGLTIGSAAIITEAEMELLDGITAGTVAASKATVTDASGNLTYAGTGALTWPTIKVTTLQDSSGNDIIDASGNLDLEGAVGVTGVVTAGGFTIGSAAITEAELEAIDGVTLGTGAASKFLSLDASGNGTLGTGTLTATTLKVTTLQDASGNTMNTDALDTTATAVELNYNDIATLGTAAASKTLTADASGNATIPTGVVIKADAATFQLKDSSGNYHTLTVDASGNVTAPAV